jgi:hypothetical protein
MSGLRGSPPESADERAPCRQRRGRSLPADLARLRISRRIADLAQMRRFCAREPWIAVPYCGKADGHPVDAWLNAQFAFRR